MGINDTNDGEWQWENVAARIVKVAWPMGSNGERGWREALGLAGRFGRPCMEREAMVKEGATQPHIEAIHGSHFVEPGSHRPWHIQVSAIAHKDNKGRRLVRATVKDTKCVFGTYI